MSSDRCGECGDDFVWDAEAGSPVCLSCGTLQDPSQVVLDSHIDIDDGSAKERDTYSFYRRSTLKSFRGAHGWDLPGQGSQPAIERHKFAMREYIAVLTRRIGHPSSSVRTLFLFERAMERGHFRYGRRARLVAGASLAIALRESQKGETIKDIAYLLNESHVALARIFMIVCSLLGTKLASVDFSWHLPVLQKYLHKLLSEKPQSLPQDLVTILRNIHFTPAFRTATSLSELISRAGIAAGSPSPPTTCAICILSLEAEALSSLPHYGELAEAFGQRFDVGKEVVMRRYRIIREHLEGWVREIPWMGDSNTRVRGKWAKKVARRVDIARHLKDAIQYKESTWRTNFEANGPLGSVTTDTTSVSSSELSLDNKVNLKQNDKAEEPRPRKRRRRSRSIDRVSRFLLSPLYAGPSENPNICREVPLEAASHMITSETPPLNQFPTRLQLLCAEKHVNDITDEELFGEGELEGLLRTAEEREALVRACDWAREQRGGESDTDARADRPEKSHPRRESSPPASGEALDSLLERRGLIHWDGNEDRDDDNDIYWASSGFASQLMTRADEFDDRKSETSLEFDAGDESQHTTPPIDDSVEVLGPWRPLSLSER